MSFLVPNVFTPDTLADANAVNANFTYIDNALNTLQGQIGAPVPGFFVSTMKNSNTPTLNTTALQADIVALTAAGGGTYLLPYGKCSINGPVYVGAQIGSPAIYRTPLGFKASATTARSYRRLTLMCSR